jgi:hypothetical protein
MLFHFHVARFSPVMVAAVFIAKRQRLRSITLFQEVAAEVTLGKMLFRLVTNVIIQKQIGPSKRWVGNFGHFHANLRERLGEFSEPENQIRDGSHT